MKNLNLLFHKTYYENLAMTDDGRASKTFIRDLEEKNQTLFSAVFEEEDLIPLPVPPQDAQTFLMKTAYPGLLIGTGYAHGTGLGGADPDINMGFSFDYVSGQPYIPASSVKGLLRSAFRHEGVVAGMLALSQEEVSELEAQIFGRPRSEEEDGDGADIFFDAVIRLGDKHRRVIGTDTITPHTDGPTKNPKPIQLLKIMPDVVVEFRFALKDSKLSSSQTVTAEKKKHLFCDILELFGIGAKTNVGYGMLLPCEDAELDTLRQAQARTGQEAARREASARQQASAPPRRPDRQQETRQQPSGGQRVSLQVGNTYPGVVDRISPKFALVTIDGTRIRGKVHISEIAPRFIPDIYSELSVGQQVFVKLLSIDRREDGSLSHSLSIKQAQP